MTAQLESLGRVAKIAAVIVDGDEASRIIKEDAMFFLVQEQPSYRFLALDHYNVDIETFDRMKKLLLRIQRLEDTEFCCSLWVPVPGTDFVTLAVQNGNMNRYYDFGQRLLATPEPMKRCMQRNELVFLDSDNATRVATVLVPILNSLEEVSAVLELSSATGAHFEYA